MVISYIESNKNASLIICKNTLFLFIGKYKNFHFPLINEIKMSSIKK
jgi:hypothetical protein